MDGMNRRRFLGTALDTAALAALAATLEPLAAVAAHAQGSPVIFDPRFAAARTLAERLAGGSALRAVTADPMELLAGARSLRGVTPESVPFCLSQLSVNGHRPTLSLTRIDQEPAQPSG